MKNIITIKRVVLVVVLLFVLWFLFRTTKLSITYDGVNENTVSYRSAGFSPVYKGAAVNADMSISNMMSNEAIYEESAIENTAETGERYRENKYYRVDTEKFEVLIDKITKVIEEKNGTIKINNQSSNKKTYFNKEFYPRYQQINFTIDNKETNLNEIEEALKEFGKIRISNSNISSIEQELTNYEQRLKEIEESRKALKESKDKDWIASRDANLAKESERIKNQIENAKKESTYKTYNIDIYEVLYYNVNSIRYWYQENYELKSAINEMLPLMVKVFAILIPIVTMLLVFIFFFITIFKKNKYKSFEEKIDLLNKLSNKEIHFDVKM